MKTHNIRSNSNYPCNEAIKWDVLSIKNKIAVAAASKKIPNFNLEKVEIHPNSSCQYNCPFCYGINFREKRKIDIPIEIIEKNIFKSIKTNRKFSKYDPLIILAGLHNEPLIYKDIKKLIELIGKYNFRFGIYTNGEALDDELMHLICENSKRTKVNKPSYVSFNISASIANNRYKFLLKKIKDFVELRKKLGAPIQLNAPFLVYGNMEIKYLEKIQRDILSAGVDRIRYSLPQTPISKKNYININDSKIIEKLQFLGGSKIYIKSNTRKSFDRCYVMANTVSIDYRGDVYPCSQVCSAAFKKLSYGSIKDKKLEEIWNSKEHKKVFLNFDRIPTYCRCNITDGHFNMLCHIIDQYM